MVIAGINYVFPQKRDRRERANVRYVSLVTIVNLLTAFPKPTAEQLVLLCVAQPFKVWRALNATMRVCLVGPRNEHPRFARIPNRCRFRVHTDYICQPSYHSLMIVT
jgi:hypothetical protein